MENLNLTKEELKEFKGNYNNRVSINMLVEVMRKYKDKNDFSWLREKIVKEKNAFMREFKHFNICRDIVLNGIYDKELSYFDLAIETIKNERKEFVKLNK